MCLDVCEFVASHCSPGSLVNSISPCTTELTTSSLPRSSVCTSTTTGCLPETLFTDSVRSDIRDPNYLVCWIVRDGPMRLDSSPGSDFGTGRRGSDASFRDGPDCSSPSWESSATSGNKERSTIPDAGASSYPRPSVVP
jgi:hypothetical protein